jgi:predicted alpha-1,6-mannanase (GH76 family)
MYFRGTDDTFWRSKTDGTQGSNPGGYKTQSNLFLASDAAYFRGTDNSLWKYDFRNGTLIDFAIAAVEQLQGWYNRDTGLWNGDSKPTNWWRSANSLNALINFMSVTHTDAYGDVIENTFSRNEAGNFVDGNDYYDDKGWWALTWINAYDLTRDKRYLQMAETIFENMTGGWDNTCSGGLWWRHSQHDNDNPKNAITNELFMTVGARLFLRTSDPAYSDWALRDWTWFSKTGGVINPENNLINDGINMSTCTNNEGTTWTYNQGVILGALCDITAFTGKVDYQETAERIADAVLISKLVNSEGILTEPCEPTSCGEDGCQFKGVFIRNLAYLFTKDGKATYKEFILRNAISLLNNRKGSNQYGVSWSSSLDNQGPDYVRQTSAIDCLNAALTVGPATLPIP